MTVYAVDLGGLEQMTTMGDVGPGTRRPRRHIRTFATIPGDEIDELLAHFAPKENLP